VGGSHGATSIADGSLQLMVNRDVLDGSGARKTGNRRVTARFLVSLHGSAAGGAGASRARAALAAAPLLLAAAPAAGAPPPPAPALQPLRAPLPDAVALVSLQLLPAGLNLTRYFGGSGSGGGGSGGEPVGAAALLLRLRHVHQAGLDGAAAAAPVGLDLGQVFGGRGAGAWGVAGAVEVTADGARGVAAAEAAGVAWPEAAGGVGEGAGAGGRGGGLQVVLKPSEIKTWLLTVA
jgi:hypothetical protein